MNRKDAKVAKVAKKKSGELQRLNLEKLELQNQER